MEFIDEHISQYAEEHSSDVSDLLKKIDRETNLEVLLPRMLSGHLQGRVLAFLSKMINPKLIVEVGTYTGYSALCLAEGLPKDGHIITIEKNIELEARIKKYFAESDYKSQLELRMGNAEEILATIDDSIDLAFIDADKSNYLNYYNIIIEKMNSGGHIIADNVLWSGKVLANPKADDIDTLALKKFNSFVQEDKRVENVLLPVRDGLMIIRKI